MKQPFLLLVAVAGALAGCGPVRTTANILDAEIAIQTAQTAGAKTKAVYEFNAAEIYIKKAREEVGYSDYQASVTFSTKASACARLAALKAKDQAPTTEVEQRTWDMYYRDCLPDYIISACTNLAKLLEDGKKPSTEEEVDWQRTCPPAELEREQKRRKGQIPVGGTP